MRKLAAALMLCILLDAGSIGAPKKQIALTFDDGPTGCYTAQLLDALKQREVHATFFLCGYRVEQYPGLTARITAEGHEIGLHGIEHREFCEMKDADLAQELQQEALMIAEAAGAAAELVRPPCGKLPEQGCDAALSAYSVILWSVDPKDWATDDREAIVHRVTSAVQPGDIVLMHDASQSSVEAAVEIIDRLKRDGYTFVTVSELAAACGTALKKGCVYHRFAALS